MIGHYAYSRNDGNAVLGPNAKAGVGHVCLGYSGSWSAQQLDALRQLSDFEGAVHSPVQPDGYLPNRFFARLPGGALAVGQSTYFASSGDRSNFITHQYVLSPELAQQSSASAEQWFALPFVDADPNGLDPNSLQGTLLRCMPVAQTLAEAGAADRPPMPLAQVLHRCGLDEGLFCLLVQALADAVCLGGRQVMIAYDPANPAQLPAFLSLTGWLLRLLPLHLRSQVGFAAPYNPLADVEQFQLVLVPECNVWDGSEGVYYRDREGGEWYDLVRSHHYLCSGGYVLHMRDEAESELYRSSGAFATGVQHLVVQLCDGSLTAEELEEEYRELNALLADSGSPLLWQAETLDLLAYQQLGAEPYPDAEDCKWQLQRWLELLPRLELPQPTAALFQERMLVDLFAGQEQPDEEWFEVLRAALHTGLNDALCLSLAAQSFARLWPQGAMETLRRTEQEFGEETLNGAAVVDLLRQKLFCAGSAEEQQLWRASGLCCDENAAAARCGDWIVCCLQRAQSLEEYLDGARRLAPLLDRDPRAAELLLAAFERAAEEWMKLGLLTGSCEDFAQLCEVIDRPADPATLHRAQLFAVVVEKRQAKLLLKLCQNGTPVLYQNAAAQTVRQLDAAFAGRQGVCAGSFYRGARSHLLALLRQQAEALPAGQQLSAAARLLELSREPEDVARYEALCVQALGGPDGVLPEWVTPEWLAERLADGSLQHGAERSAARALRALAQQAEACALTEADKKRLCAALGYDGWQQVLDGMDTLYRRGLGLWGASLCTLACSSAAGGSLWRVARELLHREGGERFAAFVRWLADVPRYHEQMELLEALCGSGELNLPEETVLQQLLLDLKEAYDSGLMPLPLRPAAERCSQRLWEAYLQRLGTFARTAALAAKGKYLVENPDRKLQQKEKQKEKVWGFVAGTGGRKKEPADAQPQGKDATPDGWQRSMPEQSALAEGGRWLSRRSGSNER